MNGKRILAGLITLALVVTDLNIVNATEITTTNIPVVGSETVDATGATEYTSNDGKFKFTLDSEYNHYATISAYLGNESNVTVPPNIRCGVVTYEVKAIADRAFENNNTATEIKVSEGIANIGLTFCGCQKLQVVNLPSTIWSVSDEAFDASLALREINVADGADSYISRNGVLLYYNGSDLYLQVYPAGKTDTSYIIDRDVTGIRHAAFRNSQNLESISIPATICKIATRSFNASEKAINIYFNPKTIDNISIFATDAFYNLPSGSKIIAKNTAMANEIPNHMSNCTGTSVVDLSLDASYQKPVTVFSFSGGSTRKDLTLPVGKTDESLLSSYIVTPADTTDNVSWSIDPKYSNIAKVDKNTGRIDAIAPGDCIITGSIEGWDKPVTVNLKVYRAILSVSALLFPMEGQTNLFGNTDGCPIQYQSSRELLYEIVIKPYDANNRANITWKSSDESVATIEPGHSDWSTNASGENYYYNDFTIRTIKQGTTTITAIINDNGKMFPKSFVLNVTNPPVNISTLTASIQPQTYNGTALTPDPTVKDGATSLVCGTDYTVSHFNNINSGTANATITGIGNYTGSIPIKFTIKKADIDTRGIRWSDTARSFTGQNHKVSLQNLPVGVSVRYTNNKKKVPGKHTAVATLSYDSSNYNKPKTTAFSTNWYIRNDQTIKISSKNVSGTTIKVPYGTADFNLGSNAKTKLSYASGNNKIATVDGNGNISIKGTGYSTITVKAKKTDTYNNKTVILKIYVTPKQSAITSLKSNKKSELTVQWNKDKRATGYQIQYSTSNKFKVNTTNTVIVNKNKTTAQKIKGLKKGKTYYVRTRAYKTVNENGVNVVKYGKWSGTNNVKVRR